MEIVRAGGSGTGFTPTEEIPFAQPIEKTPLELQKKAAKVSDYSLA